MLSRLFPNERILMEKGRLKSTYILWFGTTATFQFLSWLWGDSPARIWEWVPKLMVTLSTYYSLSTSVRGQGPWSLLVACAYISCPHIYCLLVAHCAHISCPPAHTYWQSLVVLCLRSPLRFGHKLCIPSTESTLHFQRQHKVCLLSAIEGLILQPSTNRYQFSPRN